MSKANKDGWIRHRGGKCPVDEYTNVSVRLRSGMMIARTPAGVHQWKHDGWQSQKEVMAYRLRKPEQAEPEVVSNVEEFNAMPRMVIDNAKDLAAALDHIDAQPDGPIQWRDRIREIDTERDAAETAHRAAMEKLDSEREQLVEHLKAEGFALIGKVVAPAEDMSDWRNWKAGDLVECVENRWPNIYFVGNTYMVKCVDTDGADVLDECGGTSSCILGDDDSTAFKWHSRQSA